MIDAAWELLSRVFTVFRRRKLDQEFDEEFAAHIDLLTEQNRSRGMPPDEARRQAILQMGGLNATRDLQRDARGLPPLERFLEALRSIGRDLLHSMRSLASARAFTFVCVVSLGLGMGAFAAIIQFYRGITAPARRIDTKGLVELMVTPQGPLLAETGRPIIGVWPYPDFEELRNADTGMAITGWSTGLSETGEQRPDGTGPARVSTMFVSANYFSTIGVALARGPGFDPAIDDVPSVEPRVVLGYDFWQNTLGSDPGIVGKTITLDGVPHVVAGIAPAGFRSHFNFLDTPATWLFVPLYRDPRLRAEAERARASGESQEKSVRLDRTNAWVHIFGRLAPGSDMARAEAAVSGVMSRIAEQYPATNRFKAASVEQYHSQGAVAHADLKSKFRMFTGLAAMVLFIVCLNTSGMMMVRAAKRERELSIRQAVGAGRRRLVQYLFFEAVLLAFAGGALSAFVLFGIPAVVAWLFRAQIPPEFALDGAGLAISIGLCAVTSLLFGLLPALRFSRPNLNSALKDDAGGGGRQVGRVHRLAAIVQVGVAIPFLVISGVLLDRVRTSDFGFETDGFVAARVEPAAAGFKGGDTGFFVRSIRDNLKQADGVTSVTMADGIPIDFSTRNVRVARPDRAEFATAHVTRVAEGYLDTIGTPLLRGRSITAEDRATGARVAVISEPLARRLFPNGEPVGERLKFMAQANREEEFTIVGVSGDFATSQLTTERPQMLLPLPEQPASRVFLIARGAAGEERKLASAFENAIHQLDPKFKANLNSHPAARTPGIFTGKKLVDISHDDLIAESAMVAAAGAVVLLLAALGVFGVIGFMVATRTREIAIRMALGATRPRVMGLLLSDVVKLVLPGVAGGLLISAVLVHNLQTVAETPLTLTPTIGYLEPVVYVVAAGIGVFAALLAGLPAARRAASVQPMIAMRAE